jgi:hypothetical protein
MLRWRTVFSQLVIITLVSFITFSTFMHHASAQVAHTPIGLTLTPVRTELEISPGTSVDGALTITNTTQSKMSVSITAESFSVINPQYDYAFDAETELTKWVHFSQATYILEKGETKTAPYTIGVPLSAEPGGRYLSLFASYDVSTSDTHAQSRQRVGSLLYINVSGDASRQGSIISLKSPSIITGRSLWSVSIRNSGTTHFRSRYSVTVESIIGNGSVAQSVGNILILPGTVRLVTDTLPLPSLPGIYRLTYTIGLGDTPAQTMTYYIVYLPPVVIVVALLAIILTGSLITQKVVRKRRASSSAEQQYKLPK